MTPATFFERPASTEWEVLPVPGVEGVSCWAWYRPQHLPHGAAVAIPPELIGAPLAPLPFSLFHLIHGLGLPWESLASVSLYGGDWQPAAWFHTTAEQPLPGPPDATNTQILLMTQGASSERAESQPLTAAPAAGIPAQSTSAAVSGALNRLQADWRACQGIERQLAGMRQQLSAVLGRLGGLDRDLRPEENLAADRLDKDAWQDARRWIREAASKVHKCIKAHDIGITSAAGRRNMIQEQYEQSLVSAAATGDLTSSLHDVEAYRRELANLQNGMSSALQGANANAVQRAQRILSKIAAQTRQKRAKDRGSP